MAHQHARYASARIDPTEEFRRALEGVFALLGAAHGPAYPYTLQSGKRPRLGFATIEQFTTTSSEGDLGVQGGDVLASSLRVALTRPKLSPVVLAVAKQVGRAVMQQSGRFDLIASEVWAKRAFERMLPE